VEPDIFLRFQTNALPLMYELRVLI